MLAVAPDNRITSHPANRDGPVPSRPEQVDEEIAIIRRGQHNPQSFAPLYERYVDAVFGYCFTRTSDRELAADLTQQIFAKALTALPQFTQRANSGSFRSWLFAIAHNLLVDTYRTRKETSSLDEVDEGRVFRDQSRSPEEIAIASEQRRALAKALTELTVGQRQVVELRLAGQTGPEIAATLDMHLAAVKSAQFRAYARLRDLLGESLATTRPTLPGQETRHD